MKNEYKIGELAEYFGISRDTLRHYDKLGILSPPQNNDNGYRIYSRADLLCMIYIKDLREAGVSLKDIAKLMKDGSVEKAEAIMQVRQASIKKEIEDLEYKYCVIEDYKLSYRNIISTLDEPKVVTSPQMIYLMISDYPESLMLANKAFKSLDKSATPRLTFIHSKEYIDRSDYKDMFFNESHRDKMLKWALSMIDDKNFEERRSFDKYPFKLIRPCKAIHAFIETEVNNDYSAVFKLIEYMKKNNYTLSGDIMFRSVAFRNLSKQGADYYEVLMPIK